MVQIRIILTKEEIIRRHPMIIKSTFRKSMAIVCELILFELSKTLFFLLDSDVELAPSDNPTTSTFFASMLRTFDRFLIFD